MVRWRASRSSAPTRWPEAASATAVCTAVVDFPVPTLGALHAGHLALIDEAERRADHVVATIFVNPTQFNDKSDLERYPRREEEDAKLLAARGCDLLWIPKVDDIYPPGFATTVHV